MSRSSSLAWQVESPPDVMAGRPDSESREGSAHLAWFLAATGTAGERRYQYLLLLRFALVNLLGVGLLALAKAHGLVDLALGADSTHLVPVIFLVFVAGLVFCAVRIWQTSRELNKLKPFDPLSSSLATEYLGKIRGRSGDSRALLASAIRLKLSQRIAPVRHVANSLVLLGLVGTVVGFIIALSGVDPNKAADFETVAPMISTLIEGMSTALYTTLVGAVLNIWLTFNFHLLTGGTVKLITALVELGEEHVGS